MVVGMDLFKELFLVDSRAIAPNVDRSRRAVLPCGFARAGDIVWLNDGRCGKITMFYEIHGAMLVAVTIYNATAPADPATFFIDHGLEESHKTLEEIVDCCTYYVASHNTVKVAIPPIFLLSLPV